MYTAKIKRTLEVSFELADHADNAQEALELCEFADIDENLWWVYEDIEITDESGAVVATKGIVLQ